MQCDQIERTKRFAHQAMAVMVRCREQEVADLMSEHAPKRPSEFRFADIWTSDYRNQLTACQSAGHRSRGVVIKVNWYRDDRAHPHASRSKRRGVYRRRRTPALDDHGDGRDVKRASVRRVPSNIDVVWFPDRCDLDLKIPNQRG